MRIGILAALAVALSSPLARAADDRGCFCGPRLVEVGESMGNVALKCGKPTFSDRRIEKRDGEHITVEEWTYNLGPYRFTPTFRFENGRLVSISIGDYGI
jgi:uncharacterized protein DUF2845